MSVVVVAEGDVFYSWSLLQELFNVAEKPRFPEVSNRVDLKTIKYKSNSDMQGMNFKTVFTIQFPAQVSGQCNFLNLKK